MGGAAWLPGLALGPLVAYAVLGVRLAGLFLVPHATHLSMATSRSAHFVREKSETSPGDSSRNHSSLVDRHARA